MSHFTVVVACKHPAMLDVLLAPYDENTQVAPYREYQDSEPEKFWAYDQFRAEGLIPEHPTWAEFAEAYNAKYGEEDGNAGLLVTEDGKPYEMSTYNPESKWDWWTIGGRWTGYFRFHKEHAKVVLRGEPGLMTSPSDWDHCDGGPKYALDLERMRKEAGEKARKRYHEYQELVKDTPEAMTWKSFTDNISDSYTINNARQEYHSQPRIAKLEGTEFAGFFSEDSAEEFAVNEDKYALRAERAAIPGYALVTPDGHWMAPGKMGWWGMASDEGEDRAKYLEKVNSYIDSLPDDMWLIQVDCHI